MLAAIMHPAYPSFAPDLRLVLGNHCWTGHDSQAVAQVKH